MVQSVHRSVHGLHHATDRVPARIGAWLRGGRYYDEVNGEDPWLLAAWKEKLSC
jgi:hypothetical protein